MNNLGRLLQAKGDFAAAEPLYREALEGRRETLGSGHPDTLCSIGDLSMLLFRRKLGSTYTYIASLCRSPSLGSVTAALCAWTGCCKPKANSGPLKSFMGLVAESVADLYYP